MHVEKRPQNLEEGSEAYTGYVTLLDAIKL